MAKKEGGRGRPGGNPDLAAHQFKAEGEPRLQYLGLRVSDRQAKIKELPNWQEILRQAIDEILKHQQGQEQN